jgi:hypothetical protein
MRDHIVFGHAACGQNLLPATSEDARLKPSLGTAIAWADCERDRFRLMAHATTIRAAGRCGAKLHFISSPLFLLLVLEPWSLASI